jgi:hypothetical protein
MNCPVIIQTCDKYSGFWDGLFRHMAKQWDPDIGSPIFFCNEEIRPELPRGWHHMPTGKGTFVENLRFALERLGEENIFYMLEDFWPTSPMSEGLFSYLHKIFVEEDLDALQVSSYLPYYSLDTTSTTGLFRFRRDSEWIFNLQARFWRSESFLEFLSEPEISESVVGSAITAEMASDRAARKAGGLSVMLHHYLWYPISGVSYRGEFTEIGRQMKNVVEIDRMVEGMFSGRP